MSEQSSQQINRDDEGICTEFTTEHGVSDKAHPEKFYFAFICPECGGTNPLMGDPRDFKNLPYRCMDCNWVSLLLDDAIDKFVESEGIDP